MEALLAKKTVKMLNWDYDRYYSAKLKLESEDPEANKSKIAFLTARLEKVIIEISKRPAPTTNYSFPESPGESFFHEIRRPSLPEVPKAVTTVQPELQFDTDPHSFPEASNEAHEIDSVHPSTTVSQTDDVDSVKSGGRVSSTKLNSSAEISQLSTLNQRVDRMLPKSVEMVLKVDCKSRPESPPVTTPVSTSPIPTAPPLVPSRVSVPPLLSTTPCPETQHIRRSGRVRVPPDRLEYDTISSRPEVSRLGSKSALISSYSTARGPRQVRLN